MIAGLQGSGKTTFSGKLAAYIKKQNTNVLLAAYDMYRPAAKIGIFAKIFMYRSP